MRVYSPERQFRSSLIELVHVELVFIGPKILFILYSRSIPYVITLTT